jgi:pimeloyl-ACP methyl ester carboxylesterase
MSAELVGHGGRRVHNRLFKQESGSETLTVIVAGFGYTIESPYLFYSKHTPFESGSDVLAVDFEYSRNRSFLQLDGPERDAWFGDDVAAVGTYLTGETHYAHLNFVGKSLGTSAVFSLLENPDIRLRTGRVVWITPGSKRAEIAQLLLQDTMPSLVVYGEQDPYAADAPIEHLQNCAQVDVFVVPGADHALESSTPDASVGYLREYLGRLRTLFGET